MIKYVLQIPTMLTLFWDQCGGHSTSQAHLATHLRTILSSRQIPLPHPQLLTA
jgi:hypothetical protein